MRNTLILIITILSLVACKKKQIFAEGYLIDEKTGQHFNPYNNAIVILFDNNGGNSRKIGSSSVDENGYYKITGTNKTGLDGKLQLTRDNHILVSSIEVTISNKMHNDFVIPCYSSLRRVFKSQSFANFDSIIVTISNSKGTKSYKNYNPFSTINFYDLPLVAEENNFIFSSTYINGVNSQHIDTINKGCRSIIRDTINI